MYLRICKFKKEYFPQKLYEEIWYIVAEYFGYIFTFDLLKNSKLLVTITENLDEINLNLGIESSLKVLRVSAAPALLCDTKTPFVTPD